MNCTNQSLPGLKTRESRQKKGTIITGVFPEALYQPEPDAGNTRRNADWQRVEPGIWLICKAPRTYWIEVRKDKSRKKACRKVYGNIHEARRVKQELWLKLEMRTMRERGYYPRIWRALGYYIHKHYSKTAQYREGSGKAIMRFWMYRIGQMIPKQLQNTDINKTIQDMRANGFKTSGTIPYVSRLKTALQFARKAGKIELNSTVFDDLIKLRPEREQKLTIADRDIESILSSIPAWGRPVIIYKQLVPCRLLELYDARAESIDLQRKCFHLEKTKTGLYREMPIPDVMLEYFRYAKASGSEWVFFRKIEKDGKKEFRHLSRNHLTKLFSQIRDDLGLNKHIILRRLRHSAVRKWLRVVDEGTVAAVAGASADTLRTFYDMVEIGTKVDAANRIAGVESLNIDFGILSEGRKQ